MRFGCIVEKMRRVEPLLDSDTTCREKTPEVHHQHEVGAADDGPGVRAEIGRGAYVQSTIMMATPLRHRTP